MSVAPSIRIPATYMRGGTSKGVFFNLDDLPEAAKIAGDARDRLMLRVLGSPDPYGKQIDGMGGATSSTSKVVILSKSTRPDHDVDYLFGQVAIDRPFVDWSGNCGNLSAAVGSYAITQGWVDVNNMPEKELAEVRIWQANIQKTIIARVPVTNGEVQEAGDFELDGVTFPAAEIELEFWEPSSADSAIFPTGHVVDTLTVPDMGTFEVTMIAAGIPTIFLKAEELGYQGTELQASINSDEKALARFEAIRAHGALKMRLINALSEATNRQHTPKIAFVSKPSDYIASCGQWVSGDDIDLNVRALSMGQLHHAMMGTAAVAIATAAAIPGTLVNLAAGGGQPSMVRFGHPSGTLKVGAQVSRVNGEWVVEKAVMSRSARVLMEGWLRIPAE